MNSGDFKVNSSRSNIPFLLQRINTTFSIAFKDSNQYFFYTHSPQLPHPSHGGSTMTRSVITTFFILAIILSVQPAFSLPRFALLTGSQCQSCHVDPTGGRMRNFFGFNYGKDELPIRATRDKDFEISPKLSDNVSIGADFRTQFIYEGFKETTSFQAMTATLYGTLAIGKKINIYYKQ